jgi:hypothetical protein
MQPQRRRLKQLKSLEERLAEDAKRLREEAKLLPPGAILGVSMFSPETTALLRSVLDEVCEQVGRYENGKRAHVASKLLEVATRGGQTIDELKQAGQNALRNAPR